MLALITAGMALGLLGSFHCLGMCGPLALSLPVNSDNMAVKFFGALLYNAGRVVTYSCIGLLFGALGRSFALFGFQQWLSIIMGSMILLYLLIGKRFGTTKVMIPGVTTFYNKLRKFLGGLYTNKHFSALFLIGILNGLLPCGLVYMAIAGAVASGSIGNSMLFMASFGLGTLPLMWALTFFGNYLAMGVRIRIRKAYPYVIALVACLLILRGMGLGIPYVSPRLHTDKKEMLECWKP
jgi:sulfite exporter TauE/SafE